MKPPIEVPDNLAKLVERYTKILTEQSKVTKKKYTLHFKGVCEVFIRCIFYG